MNTLLKASVLCITLVSTVSMASNFSGPEAGISVALNGGSNLVDMKNSNVYDGDYGQQSIGIKLHSGYGIDMGDNTLVLIGLDYAPTDIKAGSNNGDTIVIKNSWSLSIAPGMMLNDKTLAYVKVAYEAGKFNYKGTTNSFDESISGLGYGIGLRTEINKTTFLQTEIKQVNYKKFIYKNAVDFTSSTTTGSVGMVFKF